MLRGTLKSFATHSLIAVLVANPVLAVAPGTGSPRTSPQAINTRQADETASIPGAVRTALGLRQPGQPQAIRQVAGNDQPAPRRPGRRPRKSLLHDLFGGSNESASRPAPPQRQTGESAGLLGELFRDDFAEPPPGAQPQAGPRGPVDWDGIPYHKARSRSTPQKPVPIRDPSPNETRMSNQARLETPPSRSNAASPAAKTLPKPPSFGTASSTSRRTVPVKVVSSAMQRDDEPALSPLSSSRRSSRRELPTLDASEIAAAKAAEVSEEDLVPKISRRRVQADTAKGDEQQADVKAVAKTQPPTQTQTPQPTPKPQPTPSKDVAIKSPAAKPAESPATAPAPAPAAESVAKATPQPRQATESDAPESDQAAPGQAAANTPKLMATPQAGQIVATPAPTDTVDPFDAPESAGAPDSRELETPRARQSTAGAAPSPAADPAPIANAPAQPALPQFAAPQMPEPSAPQFGPTGKTAGHRAGPPPTAFSTRPAAKAPLKPAGTPISPASEPVGSGIAALPSPEPTPQPENRVAQNPYAQPHSRSTATIPTQPYNEPYNQPAAGLQPPANSSVADSGSGLGAPVQDMQQPAAPYQPYRQFQQDAPSEPSVADSTQPPSTVADASTGKERVAGPAQRPAAAPTRQSVDAAFSGTPFDPPAAGNRPAMRPQNAELSAEETAVASELPGIRVVTHGPRSIVIRQTQEFEIRVENRGSIDAAGLMVRAVVPDWAAIKGHTASRGHVDSQPDEGSERLVWTVDSLPAGATERLFVRLQALQSGRHGMDVDWTLLPQKSIATVEVREPKLDLIIEGPEEVVFGESQTYRVRVLNPGDGVAPNVVFTLSPNSSTPQTQRIGNIPSGKEAQFEVELTAQDLGDLKIHGLASGELGLKAEAEKNIRVAAAELEAILAGPELKYQNTDGVYVLQVTNKGSVTSKNVLAELALPPGIQYRGGIDSARPQGTKLVWQIDALPPGATREYEFTCLMAATGKHVLEFSARGSAAGKASVSLDTQVDSIADLVMTIQDPAAPAPVGSEVVYEIVIKNRGSRQATGVRAIAQFSEGIEPRRIDGHTGQVLTGQVLFDPIESIRPGQEIRIRVVAEAEREGHHRFRTEIRSGETVLVAEEATQYLAKRGQRVSRRSSSSSQNR